MVGQELALGVRLALGDADFEAVCAVRSQAYGHHDPAIARALGQVEALDRAPGVAVLMCESPQGDECLGTLRVQTSLAAPLALERSLQLPDWLARRSRAQIARLAVRPGAPPQVKLSLMRASYRYCLAMGVRWMVIGARSAALIRGYRALGFVDVFDDGSWRPLASAGGLAHRIMALDVPGADAQWQATRNRLYGFMTEPMSPPAEAMPQR